MCWGPPSTPPPLARLRTRAAAEGVLVNVSVGVLQRLHIVHRAQPEHGGLRRALSRSPPTALDGSDRWWAVGSGVVCHDRCARCWEISGEARPATCHLGRRSLAGNRSRVLGAWRSTTPFDTRRICSFRGGARSYWSPFRAVSSSCVSTKSFERGLTRATRSSLRRRLSNGCKLIIPAFLLLSGERMRRAT